MKDLIWRIPTIGFCVWLAVSCILATDKIPSIWAKVAVFISAVLWLALAGIMVKAQVRWSSTPIDEE